MKIDDSINFDKVLDFLTSTPRGLDTSLAFLCLKTLSFAHDTPRHTYQKILLEIPSVRTVYTDAISECSAISHL